MKHCQDYFQNRRKLQKELKHDRIEFKPTLKDIKEWIFILNQQFFDFKLPPFNRITIDDQKELNGHHAFFYYWPRNSKNYPETELSMNEVFADKKTFVEILAHEMVHHFQHMHGEPLGHGPTFMAWQDNFALKGLRLKKVM